MTSEASGDVPGGAGDDARAPWSASEPIPLRLGDGDLDFQLRPGEDVPVHDDPEAMGRARRFREVLGRFASGVAVVTGTWDGEPYGLTCQSFSSVSLEPPLVLFVPARTSRAWPVIRRSGRFCVNFLAADQVELSEVMASRGVDKFAGVKWTPSAVTGSPVLDGSLAHVDCTIEAVHEAGDHYVAIGRVVDLATDDSGGPEPLLFFEGRYRTTDPD